MTNTARQHTLPIAPDAHDILRLDDVTRRIGLSNVAKARAILDAQQRRADMRELGRQAVVANRAAA